MPVTASGHRYRLLLGKQTAEETLQATAASLWEASMYDGGVTANHNEEGHEVTADDDTPAGYYITMAGWSADTVINTDPDLIGVPLLGHFGTVATTGTAPNHTHTFTRSTTKPFVSAHFLRPGPSTGQDRWFQGSDGVVKAIELRASAGQPIQMLTEIVGKNMVYNPAAAPTATNDKRLSAGSFYFDFFTPTLKLDVDATPAVTTVRNIDSAVIRSEYDDAEWHQTDEVIGRFFHLGRYGFSVSVDMFMENYQALSATFFGNATGSARTLLAHGGIVVTGSMDFLFTRGPTAVANRTLQIQGPSMRWEASWPDIDVGGGPVKVSMTGKLTRPASGEAVTAILKNGTASY